MAYSAHLSGLEARAKDKASEISKKYEGTDRATQIRDLLGFAIEFRLGECSNDQDKKREYAELVYKKFDDIVESGFSERLLAEYIREMAKIIA